MSLRGRLLVLTLFLLVGGLLAADITAYLALRAHLIERNDQILRVAESRIAGLEGTTSTNAELLRWLAPRNLFVALIDADGRVLTTTTPSDTSREWSQEELATLRPQQPTTLPGGAGANDDYRVLAVTVPEGGLAIEGLNGAERVRVVVVGLPMGDDEEALRTLFMAEVTGGVIILVIAAGLVLLLLRVGLRPLDRIADTARAIEGGDHRERIPAADPRTETGRLVEALNAAFEARSASDERIRSFVADASHELRTPLTAVHGWAALYLHGGLVTWEDVDGAMSAIAGESERMKSLVDDLLALARMDEGHEPDRQRVDLAALARETVGELAPLHTDHPTTQPGS